ncbi:MAG TPA: hypothetical protein VGK67_20115 [Myxococcales bacterium]
MTWRQGLPVLVVQAETLGAIGVIRSLGRAGYPVHACATEPSALGLASRFASTRTVCPRYEDPAFLPWLHRYLASNGIRAIVPSESFLLAVRPAFSELARLLPCPPRQETAYAGMSKLDLFEALVSQGAPHLPPTLVVDPIERLPSPLLLQALGPPLYVKADAAHARTSAPSVVLRAATAWDARALLDRLAATYRGALVQGHVPGRGVGAFVLISRAGEVLAEFMHRRLHEVPHTGGASSHRESWLHLGILGDALDKVRAVQWQGVAMMEYRLDRKTGDYRFLEMNGRFWGSLHLALAAGVDFPRLLIDDFFGWPVEPVRSWRLGVKSRHTFPAEVEHVWTKLKDPALRPLARAWPIAEFALLGADPRVRSDLSFPGDGGLYWRQLASWARTAARQVFGRLRAAWGRVDGDGDGGGSQAAEEVGAAGEPERGAVRPGAPPDAGPAAHPLLPRDGDAG